MLTYLLGPFLSLLPESWRARLPSAESIRWRPATFISGALESLLSLCVLVVWYSYSVTHHTSIQIEQALRAHPNVHPNEMMMGLLGYVFVALNPVTWIICWFWFEGVIRALGAAFTDEVVGTLPLWIIDKSYRSFRERQQKRQRPPLVPDEVARFKDGQFGGRQSRLVPAKAYLARPAHHPLPGRVFQSRAINRRRGPTALRLPSAAIATGRNCSRPGKLRPRSRSRRTSEGQRVAVNLPRTKEVCRPALDQ